MNNNELMPIAQSNDERFEEYAELLIRRDQLNKEAGSYLTAYIKEFGDLITKNFEIKLECIKKKKTISYCRRRLNRNLPIDPKKMKAEIEKEMMGYYEELKRMAEENEDAKKAKASGAYRVERSKKLYHRLAKLIHPDINKKTAENETLKELWDRIVDAYHKNDSDELDDLEILVKKAMDELGEEGIEPDYEDIENRIERLERQIGDILTTEPYTYGEMLKDEGKKESYRLKLTDEYEDYVNYLESLEQALDDMLSSGGVKVLWKMD